MSIKKNIFYLFLNITNANNLIIVENIINYLTEFNLKIINASDFFENDKCKITFKNKYLDDLEKKNQDKRIFKVSLKDKKNFIEFIKTNKSNELENLQNKLKKLLTTEYKDMITIKYFEITYNKNGIFEKINFNVNIKETFYNKKKDNEKDSGKNHMLASSVSSSNSNNHNQYILNENLFSVEINENNIFINENLNDYENIIKTLKDKNYNQESKKEIQNENKISNFFYTLIFILSIILPGPLLIYYLYKINKNISENNENFKKIYNT